MFQKYSRAAHRARKTIEQLYRETPDFNLWLPNSPNFSA